MYYLFQNSNTYFVSYFAFYNYLLQHPVSRCAFDKTNLQNIFSTLERGTSETSNLNASTAPSGNEKRSQRILFLMCANKKKSLGDRSGEYGQFDVVTGQKLDSSFCCVSACMALALSR
jgi:hypothetical protein